MSGKLLSAVIAFATVLPSASPLMAQGAADKVAIDAATCMAIQDSLTRLACFEAEVRAAGVGSATTAAPQQPPALPVLPVPAPSTATSTTPVSEQKNADDFGLPEAETKAAPAEELIENISALQELEPNQFLITLANGQVWRQMRPENFRMATGQQVRIYSSRWGSDYRLSLAGGRGFIQVVRVQ